MTLSGPKILKYKEFTGRPLIRPLIIFIQMIIFRYGVGDTSRIELVSDVNLLSRALCAMLASSTRVLLQELEGERNAQFVSDMAPFNVK